MAYQLTTGAAVLRLDDGANIPDDPRNVDWQAYQTWLAAGNVPLPAPGPTSAQQAVATFGALMATGVTIASVATPALNGTYAIDAVMQQRIQAIVDGINSGKGLPHGATTIAWPDTVGARHNFAAADFLNFAAAVRDYVFDLLGTESALIQGLAASWPAQPSPIP
jgi:hypothetical protein